MSTQAGLSRAKLKVKVLLIHSKMLHELAGSIPWQSCTKAKVQLDRVSTWAVAPSFESVPDGKQMPPMERSCTGLSPRDASVATRNPTLVSG